MPTIKTIKPAGGGDYTTLQAWEDWADGEATADQWAECYKGGDLGDCYLSGWTSTVDAANHPRIYAAEGQRHNGVDVTSGAYIAAAGDVAFTAEISCEVDGLAMLGGGYGGVFFYFPDYVPTKGAVLRNLLVSSYNWDLSYYDVNTSGSSSLTVENCVFPGQEGYYGMTEVSGNGYEDMPITANILNCTTVSYWSIYSSGVSQIFGVIANSVASSISIPYFPENFAVSQSASLDGTADDFGGGGNLIDQDPADLFTDPSAGDFTLKPGSPLIGAGANLTGEGITTDILGKPRPASGPWDIGAFIFAEVPVNRPTFDDIDRLFSAPSSLVSRVGYDSRSNQTVSIDPKENTQVLFYDGASRPVQQNQHLRQRGQGAEPPEANATFLSYGGATILAVRTDYDGNGRVTALTDDNGNATLYTYDTLDRETQMIFPDGSTRTREYDQASDVVVYTDENGSEFASTFDALGRKVEVAITPAAGVIGTTGQTFEYDGQSRLTQANDTEP